MAEIDGRLAQTNGRLKAANVGVSVGVKGNRLYLRATFPPKPDSTKLLPHQQRLALGYHANPAGLKLAEQEARKVGALLDCGQFRWDEYVKNRVQSENCCDWVERFEQDYFARRQRTPKTETTWKGDYAEVFKRLPQDEPLTTALMLETIAQTTPDTRTRKRFTTALAALAKFAGLEADFKPLKGNYSPRRVNRRTLPTDEQISASREEINSAVWQRAYGLLATYGLRPHELMHLDFSQFPVLLVEDDTKTGQRRARPFYPEWAESWDLQGDLPALTGANNRAIGSRVSQAFNRYNISFHPYDLRHAWAVRTIRFGVPDSIACRWMGNSVEIFSKTYHAWMGQDVEQMVYEGLMQRSDRPVPPGIDPAIGHKIPSVLEV